MSSNRRKLSKNRKLRLGPNQLTLLNTLYSLPGRRVRSIASLLGSARVVGGTTSGYESVHSLATRGLITRRLTQWGYECALTKAGREIAEGRVVVWVIGSRDLLSEHGMTPPPGVMYC